MTTSIGYNYRHAPAVERIRELIANGELGRITNVRAVFFNGYASEPNGALSWRFKKDLAGSGALGDLLSHVVDLMQYVVGPITEVSGLLSTVHQQRPILPMGQATHFAVIENGELGEVENDDYAAALVRFAADSPGAGAVGTLEASRVIVGPQCGLAFEVYGTEGSASWNFEQMNELRLAIGRTGPSQGYTTILGNASQGDYAAFQPGPGNSLGYDDLKVVEAKKFLVAVTGGEQRNSTIEEALADAEVIAAAAASAVDGQWHRVPQVPGATFGHTRCGRWPAVPEVAGPAAGRRPRRRRPGPGGPGPRRRVPLSRRAHRCRPGAGTGRDRPRGCRRGRVSSSLAHRCCASSPAPGSAWSASTSTPRRHAASPSSSLPAPAPTPWPREPSPWRCTSSSASAGSPRWWRGPVGDRGTVAVGDLAGAVLGVVGYGRIGRRAAELGTALGMQVLAYDPVSEPPADVRCDDLAELVSRSDVITLHLPLLETPTTSSTPSCSVTSGPARCSSTAAAVA